MCGILDKNVYSIKYFDALQGIYNKNKNCKLLEKHEEWNLENTFSKWLQISRTWLDKDFSWSLFKTTEVPSASSNVIVLPLFVIFSPVKIK